ncbi:MAG: alpha/beta hydrolase [Comamonadaceae bacterium]|nr:MAG: alpha/beta hydrolase [Comamonadaceae bacterium]
MNEPQLQFISCNDPGGRHTMAYWSWGDVRSEHVVLCVHGLTRQGRDFDELARALLRRSPTPLRIVCPDVVGRGRSDWLADPQGYQVPQYASDMLALVARLRTDAPVRALDYVGTSMGGLIGMVLAGTPALSSTIGIRRLVLNDVGPVVEPASLQRIASYIGRGGRYASLDAAAAALLEISRGFGPHSKDEWLALSRAMVVPASHRGEGGRRKSDAEIEDQAAADESSAGFVLHYDPSLAIAFSQLTPETAARGEAVLWGLYDAIAAPTLLIRGAESDLLSRVTAEAMTRRGPQARLVEFDGVGHAPTFVPVDQSACVAEFLLG